MQRPRLVSVALALLMMLASACGSAPAPAAPAADAPTPAPAATIASEPAPAATTASAPAPEATAAGAVGEKLWEDFDPNNFSAPAIINNKWMPMKPGTRFVYEGTTIEDDGTAVPHRIEINITDMTKVISGIRSVVTWDLDYSDGELVEAELAFFAQDNGGNVWRMGEYPEEYDAGKFVAAPTWIHGIEEARAGIAMQAEPQMGTPSYSQGWGPAVNWNDRGQIDQMGLEICVPADCYKDVLVIAETSQAEPDAFQLKSWAPGVGNIRTGWRGAGEKTKEVLELKEVVQLDAAALDEVRAEALKMEQHAYEISKDVYAQTPPVEYPGAPAAGTTGAAAQPTTAAAPAAQPAGAATDVLVYASDLPESALSEWEFWDDAASPGGKLVGTPNTGGHLDPPPENDPFVLFTIPVQGGVPYRCWVHMKVGAPQGESQANMLWVQLANAVDKANQEVFKPDSGSYLTAQGPAQEGWSWVGCDVAGAAASESLVTFASSGDVTVRVQAGMEGVGFDQFLLSPAQFLDQPPSEAVIKK